MVELSAPIEVVAPVFWEVSSAQQECLQFVLSNPWIRNQVDQTKGYNGLYNHLLGVSQIAYAVAAHDGASNTQLIEVTAAGVLHDIGKNGLPLNIIDKPEPLTPPERLLVESHVIRGYEIIEPVFPRLADIMVGHHRYQWNRYPRGWDWDRYNGTDIPRLHSYLFLADQTHSLIDPARTYRKPWSGAKTRDYLRDIVGQRGLVDVAVGEALKLFR